MQQIVLQFNMRDNGIMKKTMQGRPKFGITRKHKLIVSLRMSDVNLKKIDKVCNLLWEKNGIIISRSHMIETIVSKTDFKDHKVIKKYIDSILEDLK